jgi:uncharacterized OB-fold protein
MSNETDKKIPPVAEGIFTPPPFEETPPSLLGGFCSACNKYYFPKPKYCRICLNQLTVALLNSVGTIYSFTVIRIRPPFGLPQPYAVGYVDLNKSGLRIFCLFDPKFIDQLKIGLPVVLKVGPLGYDGKGAPCLRPYFSIKTKD